MTVYSKITSTLTERPQQTAAYKAATAAWQDAIPTFIQAGTGVGKSAIALATAAEAAKASGRPSFIIMHTNALTAQYLEEALRFHEIGGFSFTRVVGATNYLCADSAAGDFSYGLEVPTRGEGVSNDQWEAEVEEARQRRAEWLNDHSDPARPWDRYELRNTTQPQVRKKTLTGEEIALSWACRGKYYCKGRQFGGCGAKEARARAASVEVVLTNYHLAVLSAKLRPWIMVEPGLIVVDEAHTLPDVLRDMSSATLKREHPRVAARVTLAERLTPVTDFSKWEVFWDEYRRLFEGQVADLRSMRKRPFEQTFPVKADSRLARALKELEREDPEGFFALVHDTDFEEDGLLTVGRALNAWCNGRVHGQITKSSADSADPEIVVTPVRASSDVSRKYLPQALVYLTATSGVSLPKQLGHAEGEYRFVDVGTPFDWSAVTGEICNLKGTKSSEWDREHLVPRRLRILTEALADRPQTLVLANSHADVRLIADHLGRHLPTHRVHRQQQGGGSEAARGAREDYVRDVRAGRPAVLIGTATYATGLDLPGLLTCVVWWACVGAPVDPLGQAVDRVYGNVSGDAHRARFVQGFGRLLRRVGDGGHLIVMDSRAKKHLSRATHVDQHLNDVQWGELDG